MYKRGPGIYSDLIESEKQMAIELKTDSKYLLALLGKYLLALLGKYLLALLGKYLLALLGKYLVALLGKYLLALLSKYLALLGKYLRIAQLVKAWTCNSIAGSSLIAGGVFFWCGPLASPSLHVASVGSNPQVIKWRSQLVDN